MPQRIVLAIIAAAALALLPACAAKTGAQIEYIDTFRLGAISYTTQSLRADRALSASDLGEAVARVKFKVEGSGKGPSYQLQDGDATLLAAGTPLYAVKGYRPSFRLAVISAGGIRLYECDDNPAAKTGADLLDLAGKVEYIGINSPQDGLTEIGRIKDRDTTERLVKLLLAAPVRTQAATEGDRHFVAFHLKDGTATTRVYWPQSGVLGRGIVLPAEWRMVVEGALQTTPPAAAPVAAPAPSQPPGCAASPGGDPRRHPEPLAGPASPVQVRAYVKEDPGIAVPIYALVGDLPLTVVVEFAEPVDQASFALAMADNRCDYEPGPVDQTIRWLSDQKAEITLRAFTPGQPGPYGLAFGGGKDRQGLAVAEPAFQLQQHPLNLELWMAPVGGGAARRLDFRHAELEPVSASPDGRYFLLGRQPTATSDSHSPVRIPYVLNLKTGELRAYSRGPIGEVRWDLPGKGVWVSGWQRLSLDGPGDTGQSRLDRLPPGSGFLLGALVSPDGRWLAAERTPAQNDNTGKADLILVDLRSGEARTLPSAIGYQEPMEGPPAVFFSWSADSATLLVNSWPAKELSAEATPAVLLVDPGNLNRHTLPLPAVAHGVAAWSPGGRYVAVERLGLFRPDGTLVWKDSTLFMLHDPGVWAAGDQLLMQFKPNGYRLLDLAAGAVTFEGSWPAEVAGYRLLSLSTDGKTAYFGGLRRY